MVPVSYRPEDKAGPPHHQFSRKITPITAVFAVHGVVTEGEVVVGADDELGFFIRKQRGQIVPSILASDKIVHVPGIAIFLRWSYRIEAVNIFKAGGRSVEPVAIDINVTVVADSNVFATTSDESLDVMGLLDQAGNMI